MQVRRGGCAALLAAVLAAAAPAARAELVQLPQRPELTASVLTFGPGDHPFFKFGHDALLIHDTTDGTDRVYNFGTFRFDSPRLILDFLHGRMIYWLSVSGLAPTLESYQRENRSIQIQTLRLDPLVVRALKARLDENARPQNRDYKYDYFMDNCSTRVRDAVDWAIGGGLRAVGRGPARLTLRNQALRMTASYLPLYVAIDLVLGPAGDRPIDRWTEMFIPEELSRALDEVSGPQGGIVSYEAVLFAANRPDPPHDPPAWRGSFFGVGLGVAALFWLLGWCAAAPALGRGARVVARVILGAALALWGLLVGFVGSFLVYVWGWTDHVVAHRNQNLLLCAPWSLALLVLGVGVAVGWGRGARAARRVTTAGCAAAAAGLLLKLGIAQHQDNGRWLAFFLPAWAGITAALVRLAPLGKRD
jgi:hypothetical protein